MIFEFSEYELDVSRMRLRHANTDIAIEPLVFHVLHYLIENSARVVSRDELFQEIWDGRIVSDSALSSSIKAARAAVGDTGKAQKLIRPVHGVGFHFVGDVTSRKIPSQSHAENTSSATVAKQLKPEQATRDRPSVALLPFSLSRPTDEQADFGAGLADDITSALVRIGAFFCRRTGKAIVNRT